MKLFDSHCHLNDRSYEKDFPEVLRRMEKADVKKAMIVGINRQNSVGALQLAETREIFYASVGIHPHDAKNCSEADLLFLRNLARHPKVLAWGETGLDFNRMYSPKEAQENCLISQLAMAEELHLPLIFHERDSKGRFKQILQTHYNRDCGGVVHCFSGNRPEMETYLEMGLYIGITGIATMKSRGADLRELLTSIPGDRILIETDAPYLTPAPERNKYRRNEPAFVKSVLKKIAQVRGSDPESLAGTIWQNTCRLFRIPENAGESGRG